MDIVGASIKSPPREELGAEFFQERRGSTKNMLNRAGSKRLPRLGSKAKLRYDGNEFMQQLEKTKAMLQRQNSKGEIMEEDIQEAMLIRRNSATMEFFKPPSKSLLEDLKNKFDPKGLGRDTVPDLYSDKALLMRESLKFDPLILKTLDELWHMVDCNHNGVMDRDEYREFHYKLALVLIPSISFRKSAALFEDDWDRDTKNGTKKITKQVFGDSMFELADRWTDEISATDYINFLQGTFHAISVVDPSGNRVYKSEQDLRANLPFQKPLSRLHAMSLAQARRRAAAEERARARAYRLGMEFDQDEFDRLYEEQLKRETEEAKKKERPGKLERRKTGLEEVSVNSSFGHEEMKRRHTFDAPLRRPLSVDIPEKPTPRPVTEFSPTAGRFYPPPASWWARHARSKLDLLNAAQPTYVHHHTFTGPSEIEQIGAILFDPFNPARVHHLIISTKQDAVESHAVIDLSNALTHAQLGKRQPADVLLVNSPHQIEGSSLIHAVTRTDWIKFCQNVDELSRQVDRLHPSDLAFVGFTSVYNMGTGEIGANFHFTSTDVASLLKNVSKRPRLGLACPVLHNKVAKYVVTRLIRSYGEIVGRATASDERTPSRNGLRSSSSRRLLDNLNPSATSHSGNDDHNNDGMMESKSSFHEQKFNNDDTGDHHQQQRLGRRPSASDLNSFMASLSAKLMSMEDPLARKVEGLLDYKTKKVQNKAEEFGMTKRHTVGTMDENELQEKQQVLRNRGRIRLSSLTSPVYSVNRPKLPHMDSFLSMGHQQQSTPHIVEVDNGVDGEPNVCFSPIKRNSKLNQLHK